MLLFQVRLWRRCRKRRLLDKKSLQLTYKFFFLITANLISGRSSRVVQLRAVEHLQQDIHPDRWQRLHPRQRRVASQAPPSLQLIVSRSFSYQHRRHRQ